MIERARGFTLIEVLVASAITALIGIIAYGFLGSALDAQASQQSQADRLNEINLFFVVLARDVRQAVDRNIRDEFGDTEPAVVGGLGSEYLLSLTRGGWYNPRAVARSSLQRVAYGLNDEQEIERVAWHMLDRASEQNVYRAVVLGAVEEVYFR
ncbi:MAG: type II secretion system minor pseudopilin GspJ, partial [Pseudomonadales bacterium]